MNIMIMHAHTANRGDEAAVKALIDELLAIYPDANITLSLTGITKYPNLPPQVKVIDRFPKVRARVEQMEFLFAIPTKGRFVMTKSGREFMQAVQKADLVIHAPGGPSIGDIYHKVELLYLWCLDIIRRNNKKYMFYAPSMGPFHMKCRNRFRKKILEGAECVIVRDPISLEYVKEFLPNLNVWQSLDSALQHDIDVDANEKKYLNDIELKSFLESHAKCIGITITDLEWHPLYRTEPIVKELPRIFHTFIEEKIREGYGIIFIPQLYGANNDRNMMCTYMKGNHTYMLQDDRDEYDSYFQQYLIGKLYAVVGMRYHSNIFSAKMGTPFVSISYEQKMKGFMQSIELTEYCIDLNDLSLNQINATFDLLVQNYETYKQRLHLLHDKMKKEAYKTTEVVLAILNR